MGRMDGFDDSPQGYQKASQVGIKGPGWKRQFESPCGRAYWKGYDYCLFRAFTPRAETLSRIKLLFECKSKSQLNGPIADRIKGDNKQQNDFRFCSE